MEHKVAVLIFVVGFSPISGRRDMAHLFLGNIRECAKVNRMRGRHAAGIQIVLGLVVSRYVHHEYNFPFSLCNCLPFPAAGIWNLFLGIIQGGGGAIFVSGSTLSIYNSTLQTNQAAVGSVSYC